MSTGKFTIAMQAKIIALVERGECRMRPLAWLGFRAERFSTGCGRAIASLPSFSMPSAARG